MRIDRLIEDTFSGGGEGGISVKSVKPEGLSLKVIFGSPAGGDLTTKLYPAGEAPCACASGESFDIVYQADGGDDMDKEKRRMLEAVVEKIMGLREKLSYGDWEETLGEEADSRFLCGGVVEIKVTRRCNQRCVFCKSSAKLENYATAAQMPGVLERTARRADFITFSGGETCLDPLLDRHIETARGAGFRRIEVQTNGMLMRDRRYVRRLIDAGMTNTLVSLHSHRRDISDTITGKKGGFNLTLEGIETLLAEKVHVSLCHVICSLNYEYIPDYVRFILERFPRSSMTIVNTLAIPTYRVRFDPKLMPRLSLAAPRLKEGLSLCSPSQDPAGESRIDELLEKVDALTEGIEPLKPMARRLLARTKRFLSRPGLRARVLSHCGLPLCFLDGYERYHDEYSMSMPLLAESELYHPEACRGCRWRRSCSGIWRLYAAEHGEDEIKPVS